MFTKLYDLLVTVGNHAQSTLLLLIRLCWGIQFAQAGWGKLTNLGKTTDFFASINIPFPAANAAFVGGVECFGGILLAIGLASRLVSIPLAATLVVAYLTTEMEALHKLFTFTDIDPFLSAAPFLFLFASLIVLAFGPGVFSVDYLINRKRGAAWRSSGF